MRLQRAPRRTPPESIIPLIDVVFFLLIFFMLIGRMDATAPFDVTPAQASFGQDMPGGGITLSIGKAGQIALDGHAMDKAAALEALRVQVDTSPERLIRVNAHHATQLTHVLPLVATVEAMGAQDVVLVVTPQTTP